MFPFPYGGSYGYIPPPFAYGGYHGYVPPPFHMPGSYGWTSSLDRRTNRQSRYSKQTELGSGANHHDLISFSLTNNKDPSDETLIVMNPVRAYHFAKLPTGKLEALFEELSDLHESRLGMPDVVFEEMEMREMTLTTLHEVIRKRKEFGGGDDEGDGEDDLDG